MNAPLTESTHKVLDKVSLEDKYTQERGRAFMSGVQALVRLPMMQQMRDAQAGLNTAGFISGYRGSPLGGYDQALWKASAHLKRHNIVFQPGVNEELAATAVWGTQQVEIYPEQKKFDGVFGIWYGKGPGVDRCSDVFKHANMAGTAPHGGVIAIAGDDHIAKSSTAAHQSDHIFKACGLPVFFPSDVQGILDMGLHAFALSRFSGLWSGMKTIQEVVESSASVDVDLARVNIILPEDFILPQGGMHIRWPDAPLEQEARLMEYKWYAALAYIRANKLNHTSIQGPHDRLGIMASGKAYRDTCQALLDLGLDHEVCRQIGVRVHQVNVVWPLEASTTREFALGLEEIIVVEEKRQVIEYQLKEELYNWRPDTRPVVVGKFDQPESDYSGGEWAQPNPVGNRLLRANADLSPALIAQAIAKRLLRFTLPETVRAGIQSRLSVIEAKQRAMSVTDLSLGERQPWFCSGCPHSTSTRVPQGSRAMAGIGCHYMVLWMDRSTSTFTQMGGEGAPWVGQSHFVKDTHVFANIGDGTWFHSGSLAIRQAVVAGVNITYKILYNDAVAMTGGQQVGERPEGLSVPQIVKSCIAEGVQRVAVVTDDPERYEGVKLEPDVRVWHRDELDTVQRLFRDITGTTVIVYDQTCATEKRRRRKSGKLEDPKRVVMINELVCEGCGDCSAKSNCLSVEPLETEFGRKRQINHSSCNKDESCLKGFCPSFVVVENAKLKQPAAKNSQNALPELPPANVPDCASPYRIVIAGVGGTGVITIGQLLGVAAHIEGKGVITQDSAGLAQKGGSTWSHVQIAQAPETLYATKVDLAKADLILACDSVVAANQTTMALMQNGVTRIAMNSHDTPTAGFVQSPDWQSSHTDCAKALSQAVGAEQLASLDASALAVEKLGDAIYANPLLLGFCWQKGWIPLSHESLTQALRLNAVQVERNLLAFEWGRAAALNAELRTQPINEQPLQFKAKPTLEQLITRRVEFLTQYQNAQYAQEYRDFVERVFKAEQASWSVPPMTDSKAPVPSKHTPRLSEAVARYLFKLMAYKDEYEVARLHTNQDFIEKINQQFEPGFQITHYLAPPLLAQHNSQGELVKKRFGGWIRPVFKTLKHLKFLRGTVLDPFGYTSERRTERALISEYRICIEAMLPQLTRQNIDLAVQIASVPEHIRGYGHVKARHLEEARKKSISLLEKWREQK
ncbi:indolepyruvate ferredoxin oxidoreductase family protein [Zwartia vadi]|uniref:indolepyruvate ferredoxin oxidoreductase family protein n=1 Tax=Zwartia vadi TaxID=3058168 RepID=UPI0025B5DD74|nr:indolepyruvate ferredoxin oxidoreductase family protein [Zwartia vadi]MDN3986320.1 indolepyruvate ferredoxin oxidoreductase family protein [Zwartia vadi]